METTSTIVQSSRTTCQSCANTAKAAVRQVPGVEGASVDLADQTVTVEYNGIVLRDVLADAQTKEGFPAK